MLIRSRLEVHQSMMCIATVKEPTHPTIFDHFSSFMWWWAVAAWIRQFVANAWAKFPPVQVHVAGVKRKLVVPLGGDLL